MGLEVCYVHYCFFGAVGADLAGHDGFDFGSDGSEQRWGGEDVG